MKTCKRCHTTVSRRNKSGHCRPCGIRHKLEIDPVYRDAVRQRMRAVNSLPQSREARSRAAIEMRLWEIGRPGPAGSEGRIRGGQKQSATKLAWCPPDLRDEYRRLVYSCKLSSAEAKAMILELDMARFRRRTALQEARAA